MWLDAIRNLVLPPAPIELTWLQRGGWLGANLTSSIPRAPQHRRIEALAEQTDARGAQPLAEVYGEPGGVRLPDDVRSSARLGDLYAWLVAQRRPEVVVEFGSAFGVSGMYFVSGLESADCGHLYSFEINPGWADIAETNIRSIGKRFTLTRGSVEELLESVVPSGIDMVFIDAIHDYSTITGQFAMLRPRMRPGSLLLFDDINFAKAGCRMREAWEEIAGSPGISAAVEATRHLGIVELEST